MPELLATLRKACLPAIWTQGVKLARAGAVVREKTTPTELTFRVRAPGQAGRAAVHYPHRAPGAVDGYTVTRKGGKDNGQEMP